MIRYNTYTLTPETIEEIISAIADYTESIGNTRSDTTRIRLTVEALLIKIYENPQSDKTVCIGYGKKFGRHSLHIDFAGAPFNPVDAGEDEDEWGGRLLRNLGVAPDWAYRGKSNRISMTLRERPHRNALVYILIALAVALILGFCGRFISEDVRNNVQKMLLKPTSSAFLGLLRTFAGFMIAFTVCSGILGMGSTAALKKTGKGVLFRLILVAFIFSTATMLLVLPFFRLNISTAAGFSGSHLERISGMFFDILPTDPITPFSTGNTMQIIVIAVLLGIVLLSLGERVGLMRNLIDEGAFVFQRATGLVCVLIPLFIISELTSLIWNGDGEKLLSLWKPLCVGTGLMILYSAILLFLTAWRTKKSAMWLLRTIFPAGLLGFTTASSVATLSTSMEICEEKIHVDSTLLKFAYPIGNVICKYSTTSFVCITNVALAEIYGVEITIPWIVMAIIATTLLTSAVAPVPGAIMTIYTILIAQLNIPSEGVLIAVTLDLLIDYIGAGFNTMMLMLEMTSVAKSLGKISQEG